MDDTIDRVEAEVRLRAQETLYNPKLEGLFYYDATILADIKEFMLIYLERPIHNNEFGIKIHGAFFLYHLLKKINPTLVIESGVWRGQSTWIIEQACPEAKIICLDPNLSPLVYKSSRAVYSTEDFSRLKKVPDEKCVCFFDDHISQHERLLQANLLGIKHLIFDDNYAPGTDDSKTPHLTLRTIYELLAYTHEKQEAFSHVKQYYIMPQIGLNATHVNAETFNVSIWPGLDPDYKNQLSNIPCLFDEQDLGSEWTKTIDYFSNDALDYRWLSYVELN